MGKIGRSVRTDFCALYGTIRANRCKETKWTGTTTNRYIPFLFPSFRQTEFPLLNAQKHPVPPQNEPAQRANPPPRILKNAGILSMRCARDALALPIFGLK